MDITDTSYYVESDLKLDPDPEILQIGSGIIRIQNTDNIENLCARFVVFPKTVE
jgi:hypothetical protein